MELSKILNKKLSLLSLTWPIFIELSLQLLVNNIDQVMLSRVSDKAVAAVGNVNQIMNVLVITFSVVTMATTILVSQYLGAKNHSKVSEIYTVSIFTNFIFGIASGILLFILGSYILNLIKLPNDLINDANIYMNIVGGGLFLQSLFLTYSAIFRSNGLMKQTMYISILVNILNIIGNTILLNGYFGLPKMGVDGVAISSVMSRFIGVVIIAYIFKKEVNGEISLKYIRPFPKDTFKKLINIGIPSGGENISYNISQTVILAIVNTLGTTIVTGRTYIGIIVMISYLYANAVSQANQIIVGHLIGAKEEDEAYKCVLDTLKKAMLVTLIVSGSIFIFSDYILGIFTKDITILRLGKHILFIDIFLELGRSINMVTIRGMQAAGDIKFPVMVGIISMWLISALFSYIFAIQFNMGLYGVWLAMAMDEILRGIIFYNRWRRGSWRSKLVM
ncbi:MATE family efflux transporter [Romboutsia sp. 1001713B170207_170306_H8]|uniref:MATE family efflux transporter n=1 Tax=Romboutsia sp. 1001713B170207_170306_H8 TaxID=2787112 RepID=UPI00189B9892|nr:MATE family efflux transporter [Romboutsia sp. 1001713B170207_170306_H8]